MTVLEAIRQRLETEQIGFRELHHKRTCMSADAARVRGKELRNGGKALLLKVNDEFALFVLSAERRVYSALIRNQLGTRRMRFATREELQQLTAPPGLVPLPPPRSATRGRAW